MNNHKLDYGYIPGVTCGQTSLQIYKPQRSIFTADGNYAVFVGGCGYGHRTTLKTAETFLLQCAHIYCQRRIDEAQKVVDHYMRQRELLKEGLPVR